MTEESDVSPVSSIVDGVESTPRIDDVDRAIISGLKDDPSATNRALGVALGVTEQTIAVRIRRLEDSNLMRVVALVDSKAIGYELFVIVGIQVAGRGLAEVAIEVAALPFVNGVNVCLGGFSLIASLYARDRHDLLEALELHIGGIRGIEELESFLVLERVYQRTDFARLPLANTVLTSGGDQTIDAIDRGILAQLQQDARTSLRVVARRLERSESTVRAHLRRLLDVGLCRLQTVTDISIAPGRAAALVAIKVRRGGVSRAAEDIAKVPGVGLVTITLGRFDVIVQIGAPRREELSHLILERIAPIPGVQRLEIWESLQVYKNDIRVVELSVPGRPNTH